MKELKVGLNTWLRNHLIPQLAKIFQKTCSLNNVDYTVSRPKGSFYMSDLFYVNIYFPKDEKQVLLKVFPDHPEKKTLQNYDNLFSNEILFYEKLAINSAEDYPGYYTGGRVPILNKAIVIENICPRGYFNSPKKVNLPLEYVIAELRSIARFHGNSYVLKETEPQKFASIVKNIIKIRYFPDQESFYFTIKQTNKRGTDALEKRNYDPVFVNQIKHLFDDFYNNILSKCIKPTEPLATIIHGDCTINNILFKRVEVDETGSLGAMLVDFGLIMYASPALDFVTFVYTCCSRICIKERFEELFKVYYDCLIKYLSDRGVCDQKKYSYEALYNECRRCAIFGYALATFFIPIMAEYDNNNEVDLSDIPKIVDISTKGGGEEFSDLLADMLIDMRKANLLDDYINGTNNKCVDIN